MQMTMPARGCCVTGSWCLCMSAHAYFQKEPPTCEQQALLLWTQVLVRLHADVLPHLVDPLLLTDFLTHALDGGGLNGAPLALFCALRSVHDLLTIRNV